MRTSPAPIIDIPTSPLPAPLISRLRKMTTSELEAFTPMALVPAPSTPASAVEPSIAIDLLMMMTVPKLPGSSASISPAEAVLDRAPEKVWQGAVRLHGLASLPTPDTGSHRLGVCNGDRGTQDEDD